MFRLALRNLWRNKRRTIITTVAISGGLMMMMMGNNLNHGMYLSMLDKGISSSAGHVVVQGEGWQEDPDPIDHRVTDAAGAVQQVQDAVPGAIVLQRTFLGGLLSSATNSVGVAVIGLQPDREPEVSDWHEKVVEGSWLEAGDARGIVLGFDLADSLQVGVGKKVVLMGQGKDDVASRLFRVRGIMKTGAAQMDGRFALASVEAVQEFLEEPGAASQVSLHLAAGPGDTDSALEKVKAALSGVAGLEILSWKEALAELYQFTVTDRATNNKIMFLIGLIVALGILNTILMSVMERMREFGVMLALGMGPGRLRRLILTEGLLLGLLGGAIGFLGGAAITSYLVSSGIDYSEMMGESMEIEGISVSTHIYGAWDYPTMAMQTVVAVLLAVLATVYPAWKAGRLRPVEAMRHQ